MDDIEVHVILMAGGRGERFWPRSRVSRPKQTLTIQSTQPLLVESVERLFPLIPEDNISISMGEHLQESFKEIITLIGSLNHYNAIQQQLLAMH